MLNVSVAFLLGDKGTRVRWFIFFATKARSHKGAQSRIPYFLISYFIFLIFYFPGEQERG